jgi:rhamnosyltransferase
MAIKATIFIPTWYGEQYLDELLKSVFDQRVSFEYEVLIYDTSSKDKTPEIIEKYAKKHKNLRHKTIKKEDFSHGRVRNEAAHDAKGEAVVYLTQDATPAHDRWLYEIVKPFELNKNIVGVMGKQIPRAHCFPLLKNEIRAVFKGFGPDFGTTLFYKDDFADEDTLGVLGFYSDVNSAARRSFLIHDIPYRDVPYAEDQLFGSDVIDAGYMKAYAPRAAVRHSNDMALGEYKHRMFDETMGLKKIGQDVSTPSMKHIGKAIIVGCLKDAVAIMRDGEYSTKRKLYWFVMNPFYHIEKWRGVRLAAKTSINDDETFNRHSLEKRREK